MTDQHEENGNVGQELTLEDQAEAEVAADQARSEALMEKWCALTFGNDQPDYVAGEYEHGTKALDACEDALEACLRDGVHPREAYVRLPYGYATVEFLLFAHAIGRP